MLGWVAFADPVGPCRLVGAVALVAGILVSTVPWDLSRLGGRAYGVPSRWLSARNPRALLDSVAPWWA